MTTAQSNSPNPHSGKKLRAQSPVVPSSNSMQRSKSPVAAALSSIKDIFACGKHRSACASGKVLARVVDIDLLTDDIKLVTVKVCKGKLSFQAGQFIGVYDGLSKKKDSKTDTSIFPGTYSIASPPSSLPYMSFAIGEDHNPRNLRHFLYSNAKVGDPVLLDTAGSGTVAITPRMVMTPIGGPGGLMLIGGGSAVMGLVSIVEELLHDKDGQHIPAIKLFHSNKSNSDIPFYDRMNELEQNFDQFHYHPHITGALEVGEEARGEIGRVNVTRLAKEVAGVRLFCICGSGVFCEAIVDSLLALGVWPGSIRTDYTTRVDPARRLHQMGQQDDTVYPLSSTMIRGKGGRFEACVDATQSKGTMKANSSKRRRSSGLEFLQTYGLDTLMDQMLSKLASEKPNFPLQFLNKEIQKAHSALPEVKNANAGNPEFWINYWETDTVTWQAPIVSPWLEKYMHEFVGSECKDVFVPLCGKSLDMKLLLERGHHVVGADCSGIACADFFAENGIPDYVTEEVNHPKGKRVVRHKSTSLAIEIYECDLFDLTADLIGPINRVLDRAALVALPPSIIESNYLPLLSSLLCPGGKMLFASVSELPFPKAPPHAYEKNMIETILSGFFAEIELKEVHRYRVNAGHVSEPVYMLTSNEHFG